MPEIARFYGIIIRMFYDDHAVYAEHELEVGISPIRVLVGDAPGRVRSMVLEWAALHQSELLADWERCRRGERTVAIAPLE